MTDFLKYLDNNTIHFAFFVAQTLEMTYLCEISILYVRSA